MASSSSPSKKNEEETRRMNDTTMAPSSSQGVAAPTTRIVARKQERLRKGFGLSDWVQLTKSAKNLSGRGTTGLQRLSRAEIAKHNMVHDGWIILNGKVYNIAPYLHYHPGGITILKPYLGKDASTLFDKYHPWVNADGLIGTLLLGYVDDTGVKDDDDEDGHSYLPLQVGGFAVPAPRPPKTVPSLLPNDIDQDDDEVTS